MKYISSNQDQLPEKRETSLICGGVVATKVISKEESPEELVGFVTQQIVSCGDGYRLVTYIHNSILEYLASNRAYVSTYIFHRFCNSFIEKHKINDKILMINITEVETPSKKERFAELFFYENRKLRKTTNIPTLSVDPVSFAHALKNKLAKELSGEWKDTNFIHLFSNIEINESINEIIPDLIIESIRPYAFSENPIVKWYQSNFGHLKQENIHFKKKTIQSQIQSSVGAPLLVLLFFIALFFSLDFYKRSQFADQQTKFKSLSKASSQVDQAKLNLWDSRRQFWNSITDQRLTTDTIRTVTSAIGTVSQQRPDMKLILERLESSYTKPIVSNQESYNTQLNIGIKVSKIASNNDVIESFIKLFTGALADNITGTVDLWMEPTSRIVNKEQYIFIKLYFNAKKDN